MRARVVTKPLGRLATILSASACLLTNAFGETPSACLTDDAACWRTTAEAGNSTVPNKPLITSIRRDWQPNTEQANGGISRSPSVCAVPAANDAIPFSFSVDGRSIDRTGTVREADSQRCADVALRQADIQIRYDGLNNDPRLNVVASPDAVKLGSNVVFETYTNYAPRLARGEIRIFEKGETTRQAPLAVIPIEQGHAHWIVPEKTSDTVKYIFRVYDARGRFDETSSKVLDIAALRGGKTPPEDLSAVYNGNALEVRNIPHSGGAILVSGRDIPPGSKVSVMGLPVPVDPKGDFAVRQLVASGPQQISVAIVDPQGRRTEFSRSASIPDNDIFYVALADLTAGHNVTNNAFAMLNPSQAAEYQDKVFVNGRLAFYLKGKILGETLITAAADTKDQPIKQLFSNFDSKDPRYLLRNLDPNKYYPVYGDDSTLVEDAPTRGKFYVRLENGENSIVWGNFKTTITGTEFIRYDRGLYGLRGQAKTEDSTQYGERRGQVEAFAAQPGTIGGRDVFRGTGGSLYYMSRQNLTQGSERVTVEVRDQVTGLILQTRTLVATQDYTIDYLQGRINLVSALSSVGAQDTIVQTGALSGTQQYLVINYEYAPGLQAARDKIVGGRASYWVNDHVEVGTTGYDQEQSAQKQQLAGADMTLRYKPGTYVKFEGARSNGIGNGEQYSLDGGYTFTQQATAGTPAWARRIEAAADLADIIGGAKGRVAGYWKDKDNNFSGPGELSINGPSREMGIKSDVVLDQHWSEKTKLDHREDQFRHYSAGEQNLTYSFDDYWRATVGARLDNNAVKTASASSILNQNGSRDDVALRIDYDSKRDWSVYSFGQVTVEKSGQRDDNNRIGVGGALRIDERTKLLAEISDGNGGLGGKVGMEYKIDEKRSSYLNYDFNPDRTDIISRGGAGILVSGTRERFSDSFSVFGEEHLRYGGGYSGLTHAFGLDFIPQEHWKTGLTFETGELTDPLQGDVKRTSVSPSIGYTKDGLTTTSKFEYRHDDTTTVASGTTAAARNVRDTYLMNNAVSNRVSKDWRFIGRLNGSYSDTTQGTFYQGNYLEAVTGFAYRPVNNDKLNALFKYTYFYDLPSPGQTLNNTQANSYAQQSHVLSVDTTYDLTKLVSIGGKYALRTGLLKDTTIPGPWFDSQAQLVIGRVDLHLVSEWDVSAEVRWLDTSTAKSTQSGALVAIYRHVGDNFKIGGGYNFTHYTEDLANLTANNQGFFVNAVGKF